MEKPAIVFVPGAWHVPEHYASLLSRLQKAGYEVHDIDMPTVGDNLSENSSKEDVAVIRQMIQGLADQSKDVVVVMHSMGGIPGSSASEGLSKADREKDGKKGGIVHLVFLCAFAASEGVSLWEASGGPDSWYKVHDDGKIVLEEGAPAWKFYNDVGPEVYGPAVARLRTLSKSAFTTPCTYAAWKHIPSTYLICEKDNAIPLAAQVAMVSRDIWNGRSTIQDADECEIYADFSTRRRFHS
jgi:pimeloyl-ACP methyl ester carboxylesterase